MSPALPDPDRPRRFVVTLSATFSFEATESQVTQWEDGKNEYNYDAATTLIAAINEWHAKVDTIVTPLPQ